MSSSVVEIVDLAITSREGESTELAEAMEAHVQRVTQSSLFIRAETLRKLLLYLWAHREEEISEYAVATEALGRRSDFDPKMDASARVQISRLRRKLKDYYETEGVHDGFTLHIPMGTHVLSIVDSSSSLSTARQLEGRLETRLDSPIDSPVRWQRWVIPAMATICSILLLGHLAPRVEPAEG